jgi:hypothetical protein
MAMEESGEYRVTRSKGRGPGRKIHKVIFRHLAGATHETTKVLFPGKF